MDQCGSLITKLITMILNWYSGNINVNRPFLDEKITHNNCWYYYTESYTPIVVTPSRWIIYKRWSKIICPATYQSPPKSYIAGPRQVSEATSPLSRSNHREKSQRKAEEKKYSTPSISLWTRQKLFNNLNVEQFCNIKLQIYRNNV